MSKWHYGTNETATACGLDIHAQLSLLRTLRPSLVDCKRCLKWLDKDNPLHEEMAFLDASGATPQEASDG